MAQKRIPMFRPFVNTNLALELLRVVLSPKQDGSFWIGEGPKVYELEQRLCKKFGWRYAIAVNGGTAGLHLALAMAGVGPGDEVITTPMTCSATTHAIMAQGAKPVFADIQYLTGNIDPNDIKHRVTGKTRAIMCVHWAGYPCDLIRIRGIANFFGLPVIEDAAHALGATYRGMPIGAISDYTVFSLQAIKQLTTGDGGILTVLTPDRADEAMRRRWFGIDRKHRRVSEADGYAHWRVTEVGYKFHMNDIAAAVGLANLEVVDWILAQRHEQADFYHASLKDIPGVTLFERADDRVSGDWLFTMHVERRADFRRMMDGKGIEVSVVHLRNDDDDDYPIFGGRRDDLPVMDRYAETYISIPIGWWVSNEDAQYIADCIKAGW